MSHENPLLYIVGLVAVLFVGYLLIATGMDMGLVIFVIIALIAAGIGGNMLLQRYRKMGKEHFLNGMVSRMDPTLPAPYPDHADELTQASIPYHMQHPYSHEEETLFGAHIPSTNPPSRGSFTQGQLGRVSITEANLEVEGSDVRGVLTPGVPQPPQYTLPEAHTYELQLGEQAYVDVSQAYVNALLLDPTGNVPRVLAEELAEKGIPLLFVDITGAYSSLLAEFPYGYHLISPEAYQESTANAQTVALGQAQETSAKDFGHTLIQYGWQALFDFSTYTSPSEAMIVLWYIIDGMAAWERKQYKQSNRFLPAVIMVTDANRLCPDDDRHSLHKDNQQLAQAVRTSIVKHLQMQGGWGLYWYLITRRITGMDSETLKQCILWIVEHPSPAEVRAGWLSAYLGVSPDEIARVPHDHALILDRKVRTPQIIRFRRSHSEPDRQTDSLSPTPFSLPQLNSDTGTDGAILPFQKR